MSQELSRTPFPALVRPRVDATYAPREPETWMQLNCEDADYSVSISEHVDGTGFPMPPRLSEIGRWITIISGLQIRSFSL